MRALFFALILASPSLAPAQISTGTGEVLYGVSNGRTYSPNNLIYRINPVNGDLSGFQTLHCPPEDPCIIASTYGLAARPSDGALFTVQHLFGPPSYTNLMRVNPANGVSDTVGTGWMIHTIESIGFRFDGTLYGVTGAVGLDPYSLFSIDATTGLETWLFSLGAYEPNSPSVIAFQTNGYVYRSIGINPADFEWINSNNGDIFQVPRGCWIGNPCNETVATAMGYSAVRSQMFLTHKNPVGIQALFTVDISNGVRTWVGEISDQLPAPLIGGLPLVNAGLAFVPAPPICLSCGTE